MSCLQQKIKINQQRAWFNIIYAHDQWKRRHEPDNLNTAKSNVKDNIQKNQPSIGEHI